MPRVLKRPEAESDLEVIWWFVARDNPDNADRLLDRIQEMCSTLASFPKIGAMRDTIMRDLRSHPVGNYLIFYFPLDDGIDIIRVLHGSRDVEVEIERHSGT